MTRPDVITGPGQLPRAHLRWIIFRSVAIVAGGTGRIAQDGRQAVLHPGDCVLYENTRPFQWLFDSDWDVWVFSLPSESVRLSDTERRLISARRLDGTIGLTGVVSRFLLDLARHGEDLPAEQSERVLAHASDLVVTLLGDRLDDSTRARGAVQRSLMLRIKDYIHQRLRDPALVPAEIAAAVNISTRYLHKLFEADHQTVSLYIKGLRLDRARQDLLDPRLAGRPISTIAYSCGFGDLSGFNRAFKQAYAVSPRELRNASASTMIAATTHAKPPIWRGAPRPLLVARRFVLCLPPANQAPRGHHERHPG